MPKAYGYCRASTHKQAAPGLGLDAQKDEIRRCFDHCFAATHEWGGWCIDPEIFGGTKFRHRTAGGELNLRLERGDAMIFARLNRGFPSTHDAMTTLLAWEERGVAAKIIDLDIDTATPSGKLMVRAYPSWAEYERGMRQEQSIYAHCKRQLRGRANGVAGYGWKRVNGRNVPIPEEQKVISKLVELWEKKRWSAFTIRQWIRHNGIKNHKGNIEWHPDTIRKIIRAAQRADAEAMSMMAAASPVA